MLADPTAHFGRRNAKVSRMSTPEIGPILFQTNGNLIPGTYDKASGLHLGGSTTSLTFLSRKFCRHNSLSMGVPQSTNDRFQWGNLKIRSGTCSKERYNGNPFNPWRNPFPHHINLRGSLIPDLLLLISHLMAIAPVAPRSKMHHSFSSNYPDGTT
jgi:hypothetical protein